VTIQTVDLLFLKICPTNVPKKPCREPF